MRAATHRQHSGEQSPQTAFMRAVTKEAPLSEFSSTQKHSSEQLPTANLKACRHKFITLFKHSVKTTIVWWVSNRQPICNKSQAYNLHASSHTQAISIWHANSRWSQYKQLTTNNHHVSNQQVITFIWAIIIEQTSFKAVNQGQPSPKQPCPHNIYKSSHKQTISLQAVTNKQPSCEQPVIDNLQASKRLNTSFFGVVIKSQSSCKQSPTDDIPAINQPHTISFLAVTYRQTSCKQVETDNLFASSQQ